MKLTISNLSKTYPKGARALKNVNLTISTGMFGLLGPNGAGKSSLMRTLATLQEADTGEIFLDDLDVLRQKDEVRKILGYLPQEFGLYPNVTAEELLNHIAALKGINHKSDRREIVPTLLHKVNLYQARKKNLGTFSGGMKQRFGIAQALIGNPKLIIVDEPTAGLDPTERNRFHNLLSEIGENTVVILSTHIVEDVSHLCTNMAIICEGKVLKTGEPSGLLASIKGRLWKKVVARADLSKYQEEFNVISSTLNAGKTVLHVYSETQLSAGFEPIEGSLEDVYFATISETLDGGQYA